MSLQKVKLLVATSAFMLAGLATAQDAASTSSTKVAPQSGLENWSLKYQNYTNGPTFEAPTGPSVNHFIDLSHKVGNWTLAGVGRFNTTADHGKEAQTLAGDHYAKVITPSIGDKTKINGNIRYHVPTSEASKKAGQEFAIEPRLYITRAAIAPKLDFVSSLRPMFFGYEDSKSGQKVATLANAFEFNYELNPMLTLDVAATPGYQKNRDEEKWVNNQCPVDLGTTIKFHEKMTVSPFVEFNANRPKMTTSYVAAFVSYTAF